MRFAILALLLLATESRAERGHQAYRDMIKRDARRYEEWANKPCTPRGRYLAHARARIGKATLWRYRLYSTGYWTVTFGAFDLTRTGCDRAKRRHVFLRRY